MNSALVAWAITWAKVVFPTPGGPQKIMEETRCDGALYHVNRSCKILTFLQAGLRRGIYERNHKPFATFDGDQTDPTTFSPAQFETRVQALRENMEAAKAERGGP